MSNALTWASLALLGAFHGINPAMGWLFSVARGLHQRRWLAVVTSLVPIAVGHLLSLAAVVAVVGISAQAAPTDVLRVVTATALVLFGGYRLFRPGRHPRWVRFQVSPPALALWSLIMSTAHGAGLMILPILLNSGTAGHTSHDMSMGHDAHTGHSAHTAPMLEGDWWWQSSLALAVHTVAMLLVMGLVALLVYQFIGLRVLRKGWVNFDTVWAVVLIGSGLFLFFV